MATAEMHSMVSGSSDNGGEMEEEGENDCREEQDREKQIRDIQKWSQIYTYYNFNLKNSTVGLDEFYHLEFMACMQLLSCVFLGETSCHDLLREFRRVERIVLFSKN